MTPLVGLTIFAYLFLIALCLTLWAALTVRDGRGSVSEPTAPRRESGASQRLGERPLWRADERAGTEARSRGREPGGRDRGRREGAVESVPLRVGLPPEPPQPAQVADAGRPRAVPAVTNDDVRGAKVTVKQRKLEDAFDRFLEVDKKDRGF